MEAGFYQKTINKLHVQVGGWLRGEHKNVNVGVPLCRAKKSYRSNQNLIPTVKLDFAPTIIFI
jgi:hypothetical protein